jgi:hypothetical protein
MTMRTIRRVFRVIVIEEVDDQPGPVGPVDISTQDPAPLSTRRTPPPGASWTDWMAMVQKRQRDANHKRRLAAERVQPANGTFDYDATE